MLNLQLSDKENPEVEQGEITYFALKKGEKIDFKLIREEDDKDGKVTTMLPSEKEKFTLSKTSCPSNKGCSFTVEAKDDIELGSIYFSGNVQQKTE